MSDYSDLLQDPRWQRKRLEIMQRDNWTCCRCGKATKTLHVHHIRYVPGAPPWESPAGDLQTLCEDCHSNEHGLERQENVLAGKAPAETTLLLSAVEVAINTSRQSPLTVLAARPAVGKTSFALSMAPWLSRTEPVMFVTLQESQSCLFDRIIACTYLIDRSRYPIRDGKPPEVAARYHAGAVADFTSKCRLSIESMQSPSVSDVIRNATDFAKTEGHCWLFIDYMQLLRHPQELPDIQSLREFGVSNNCSVVCLSQLGRECELRDDKLPRLADVEDDVAQIADTVMLLHRYTEDADMRNSGRLIVAKSPHVNTGTYSFHLNTGCGRVA